MKTISTVCAAALLLGTFMHELGHNLGLHHGGGDDMNWKPNYLSVMNYTFQLDGLIIEDPFTIVHFTNLLIQESPDVLLLRQFELLVGDEQPVVHAGEGVLDQIVVFLRAEQ